jgi:two-component system sensor histidine kinase GlrK
MLFGLITVVAPLCVAIFYTVQTLDELASQNQKASQHTISLTRSSQFFETNLLDLERRARQFVALGDPDLLELFVRERKQLQAALVQINETLTAIDHESRSALYQQWLQLDQGLQAIPQASDEISAALPRFDELSAAANAFRQQVQAYVDAQLGELSRNAEDIQRSLMLMVALLAVLTLIFSLLLIYWIATPVKQIGREIRQLGSGDMSQPIQISGPAEMQLLGNELEWLRKRLDELEQQKLQFLRHMSHELKTPLASLREGADLLAEGVAGELQAKQSEVVDIIRDNSRELQRLIENLLDYNQVVHNQQLDVQPLSLHTVWQELMSTHQISIEQKQLQIDCEGDVESWPLDEAKFRTVLDNLLSNAVNYAPEKGRIDIGWHQQDEALVMEVANSGKAIPKDEWKKIFEPFYQGVNSRTGPIKGSGIGLSVARECILAHGGTLTLSQHPELPVCFRITCPTLENNGI